jgi:L-asparaginase II
VTSGLTVESLRGGLVESVHRVSLAVVDADGALVAYAGDPDCTTFVRSAAKPFQAMPFVQDGAAERFGVTDEELALVCASHSSEPEQIAIVGRLLQRIGLREDDLACGPHRPLSADFTLPQPFPLRARQRTDTREPLTVPPPTSDVRAAPTGYRTSGDDHRGSLASNCSGKHTGMLALARHRGWETAGYHEGTHPVQQRCRESVAQWTAIAVRDLGEGVDGCGVVAFAMPVRRLALAYARLVASADAAPRAIVQAMTGHPELVAGEGRPCTALMRAYPGRLLAKVGAEGVYGAALTERRLGIGIKIEDGHNWAAVVALWAALQQLGLDPPVLDTVPQFAAIPVFNTRGETVGNLRARGTITFV